MFRAEARRCLMAYGAIKRQILCAIITSIPSPRSATRAREVILGCGQRGGKFRLLLPEELAHDGPIIPGALGLYR